MALEIDSFVTKFKSLLASWHQTRLTLNSRKEQVWVNLQVWFRCPQPHHGGGANHQQRKEEAVAEKDNPMMAVAAEQVDMENENDKTARNSSLRLRDELVIMKSIRMQSMKPMLLLIRFWYLLIVELAGKIHTLKNSLIQDCMTKVY